MIDQSLYALSPIDGRYHQVTLPLQDYCSEAALIKQRIKLECLYLVALSKVGVVRPLSPIEVSILDALSEQSAALDGVKELEKTTKHDVKAVEYWLRKKCTSTSLSDVSPYLHFGLTSEDINNLAYGMLIQQSLAQVMLPAAREVLRTLTTLAKETVNLPMLARTHGQPAVPTTLGKELTITATRLLGVLRKLDSFTMDGKLNGAVGGFHAHTFSYPEIDWSQLSRDFVISLGLRPLELTSQINPHDDIVELCGLLLHLNAILTGFSQDIWRYISDSWLVQIGKQDDVGSSTMPQKINPIEFENAEGNLTMAGSLLEGFARKLPISRLQRDLSDSTILRNLGVAFGHSLVAYTSLNKAIPKLKANDETIHHDLHKNYAVLLEAWQTLSRTAGDDAAYEKAASLGKNTVISAEEWRALTKDQPKKLQNLTPDTYLGQTISLATTALKHCTAYLTERSHA